MKQTDIWRTVCAVMLLGSVGMAWGQNIEWKKLTEGGSLETGYYQIQDGNLTVNQTITVSSGKTVTVDLNGYVLKGNGKSEVFNVSNGGFLTIQDSRKNIEHKGTLNDKGILIWNNDNGNQSFYGGTICNAYADENNKRLGIYVAGECTVEYGNIMGCYSTDVGAAVTITSTGKFTMRGGQVSYNYSKGSTTYNRGGAIYGEPSNTNNPGSLIALSDMTVSHNHSQLNGGGICGYNVTLSDCIIEKNTTGLSGGGIYMRGNGSSLTINGNTVVRNNSAGEHGGGIYTNGDLTIRGNSSGNPVEIEKNEALRSNGAYGGGICAIKSDNTDTDVKCYIEYACIKHNYATATGGGINCQVSATIRNSTIEENWAMYSNANLGRGGGFNFQGEGVEAILDDTKVIKNKCTYYGGGGQLSGKAKLILRGNSQINNNETILYGAGGLHVTGSSHFVFESGEISYNTAHDVGGAIHSSYSCRLELKGGEIRGNTSYGRGGGVHVNTGGNLVLQGTDIVENVVKQGYKLTGCVITKGEDGIYRAGEPTKDGEGYNEKTGLGGGVFIDSGTCTMKSGSLSYNKAEMGGAGIALDMINISADHYDEVKVAEFVLEGGTVQGNEITGNGNGGGIHLTKQDWANKGIPSEHEDVIVNGVPKAIIQGGELKGNKALNGNGGALYVDGNVTMTGGFIKDENQAKNGGGVCVANGEVTITKGTISNNTATDYGGGLYVANAEAKDITISGEGVFEGNTASAGGGMAVGGPVTLSFVGTLQGNSARNGGGIYLLPGSSESERGAILHFNGGFIRNNTAVDDRESGGLPENTAYLKNVSDVAGVGGGVFLADYTTLDFFSDIMEGEKVSELGFYGNRATNAGDDIFANGKGTLVDVPDVTDMSLSDFSSGDLFWAEDYYSQYKDGGYIGDAGYEQGTNMLGDVETPKHNLRYQYALQHVKRDHIVRISANSYTEYLCLALGYQMYYITIRKTGLKEGESALFTIETDKEDVEKPYITMLLTGKAGKNTVERRVALPEGNWKVVENSIWGWSYNKLSQSTEGFQLVNDDNKIFEFTNEKNTTILHDEDIKVNSMDKSTLETSEKKYIKTGL